MLIQHPKSTIYAKNHNNYVNQFKFICSWFAPIGSNTQYPWCLISPTSIKNYMLVLVLIIAKTITKTQKYNKIKWGFASCKLEFRGGCV